MNNTWVWRDDLVIRAGTAEEVHGDEVQVPAFTLNLQLHVNSSFRIPEALFWLLGVPPSCTAHRDKHTYAHIIIKYKQTNK